MRISCVVILDANKFVHPENALSTGTMDQFWPSSNITPSLHFDSFQVAFSKNLPLHSTFSTTEVRLCSTAVNNNQCSSQLSTINDANHEESPFSMQPINQSTTVGNDDEGGFICQIVQTSVVMNAHCGPGLSDLFEVLDAGKSWVGDMGATTGMGKNATAAANGVVVMDELGGTAAALFCGLLTIKQQGLAEGSVDVYQTARLYSQARPGKEYFRVSVSICNGCATVCLFH